MAISTEVRFAGPYQGNGSASIFPFKFVVLKESDVQVTVGTIDSNVEDVLDSGYTVRLNEDQDNNPGGEIELDEPLGENMALAITTNMPNLQELVLTNRGGFYPESVNDAFDKVVIMIQQLKVRESRALYVPLTSEQTPQEALAQILDIASKANELNEDSKRINEEIKKYREEIEKQAELAHDADKYAEEAYYSKAEAVQAAHDSKESSQQSLEFAEQSKYYASKSGFGFRYCEVASPGQTLKSDNVVPGELLKAGDHIVNYQGDVFLVVSVNEEEKTCTLSGKVASFQGPQGVAGKDGKQGEKGEQGGQGPQGEKGDTGPRGPQGVQGEKGETGPQGKEGPRGPAGETGPIGLQGPAGEKGDVGPEGPQGPQGLQGPPGLDGKDGKDGKDGERGPQGEPGPQGLQGEKGPMGDSPWAAAFGQFQIKDPYLTMSYVGLDTGANWKIRKDGKLSVEFAND